jgi:molecular chaperone GrpE
MSTSQEDQAKGKEEASMSVGEGARDTPSMEASIEEALMASSADTLQRLETELAEAKDKNIRLYAEFDNFRRRTAKETFELMSTANARLIGKLIEVLDNFQRAFDPKHKGASSEDVEKGIRLIYGRFKELLEEEGLEAIDPPQGGVFDPNLHDAMLQQPSDTVPENHVLQTVQKGYKLKSKILTHAKVIVSQGKGN